MPELEVISKEVDVPPPSPHIWEIRIQISYAQAGTIQSIPNLRVHEGRAVALEVAPLGEKTI